MGTSVPRHGSVDGAGPMIDAAGKGLNVFKSLIPQPHGHRERASSMMAEHDDGLIRIKFLVCARGDIAHGHEDGSREVRGTKLPWFPNVQEDRWVRLLALLGKSLGGDLRRKHRFKEYRKRPGDRGGTPEKG
ncbi:hypothetical protein BDD14_4977 [Edaphobacter modestus]|uniref:Uncharacterized protein n=1 Tax=Edaphobacter modestus TaxID=388466 RepID=A0A4Q7Z1E5_9BACT|nr:hypothetical protein BDD14_4977 [Edaphobacter modestus]